MRDLEQSGREDGKKPRSKSEIKGIAGFLGTLLIVIAAYVLVGEATKFDYTKNLDKIVVSVGESDVSLREIAYYVVQVERTGQEAALKYDPERPSRYWGLYISEGSKAGFVTEIAKRTAMDYCIRDNVYSQEAGKKGICLLPEEQKEVDYDASDYYDKMSEREKEATGLTVEDLKKVLEKERLCYKYMALLAKEYEGGELEAVTHVYDVGGIYYEGLLWQYPVEIDEKLWDNVRVGHLTVQ